IIPKNVYSEREPAEILNIPVDAGKAPSQSILPILALLTPCNKATELDESVLKLSNSSKPKFPLSLLAVIVISLLILLDRIFLILINPLILVLIIRTTLSVVLSSKEYNKGLTITVSTPSIF